MNQQQHPLEIMGAMRVSESMFQFAAEDEPDQPDETPPAEQSRASKLMDIAERWSETFGDDDPVALKLLEMAREMLDQEKSDVD